MSNPARTVVMRSGTKCLYSDLKRRAPKTIRRLVLCGLSVLVLSSHAAAADDLTGFWAGLAPDGIVFAPTSGLCSANVTLDLAQSGASLSGVFGVLGQNLTGGCVVQNRLTGIELTTGQAVPGRVAGTVGSGTLSFNIINASLLNGVPVRFSAIVVSGVFSANRLTTAGTLLPMRNWFDFNQNNVPDCNLLNPLANGECGTWANLTGAQSLSLTAELYTAPSITSLSVTPDVLWPPNNKMVPVSLSVAGAGFPEPTCQISSVTSNEAGSTPGDIEWIVTGPLSVNLLAQRGGSGDGRVYAITVTCTNAVGSAAQVVTVSVPHDRGR